MAFLRFYLLCYILAHFGAAAQGPVPGFVSPDHDYRVKFRYWCPDASVDLGDVARDIQAIDEVGGGGIEFIPLYNYGFRLPTLPDWNEFGFGSPRFKELFVSALKAAHEADIKFDFALGANQGQGIPAEPLTPGLAMQLVYGETTVSGGGRFDGPIPEADLLYNFDLSELSDFMHRPENWGPNKLLAVIAGGVKSELVNDEDPNFTDIIVVEESLVDLTHHVQDGNLSWTAPDDYANYTLFAVYERFSNQRSVDPMEDPENIFGNGSYITDHFSGLGANLAIDFWEQNILDAEIKQLLRIAGEHVWEDSIEMSSALWWSYRFLDRFKANRGYDPSKYLPFLFHQSNVFRTEYRPYNRSYTLGDEDPAQNKYIQDYRLTLNEGYQDYLTTLDRWAQSLGLTFSAQIGYNLPLDMSASVPKVSSPEVETLAFPTIDLTSQYNGAAHLSGRNIISSEVGATLTGAYGLSTMDLLRLFKESFAAGVNAMVVHGMPYGGDYLSSWPGYTALSFGFGDMWGPRLPAWKYMNDTMAYTARNQLVLQTGTVKRDIAFYHFDNPWSMQPGYEQEDLRAAGYSYEYLGPDNIASDQAALSAGVLAPDGPAYRAMVLNNQELISPDAALRILRFAEEGFPILVLGDPPNKAIGTVGQDIVIDAMEKLKGLGDNVRFLGGSESLVEALASLDVTPRVSVEAGNSDLYTVWRSSWSSDYVFLYNSGEASTFTLSFALKQGRVPYELDAWTGEQSPILVYEWTSERLVLTVHLESLETMTLAFLCEDEGAHVHVTQKSPNVRSVRWGPDKSLVALLNDEQSATLTLSNGNVVDIESLPNNGTLTSTEVTSWNLAIDSWVPDADESQFASAIETFDLGELDTLLPWTEIPGMTNVSGVGICATELPAFANLDQTSVIINFGPILSTVRAWINDALLPPIDPAAPQLDITEYLSSEPSALRVEVSSNLFNAVKARVDWVQSLGEGPIFPEAYLFTDPQPFGLVGPVVLESLRRYTVPM